MNTDLSIPILHDGGRWLVVEKPAGLPTQAAAPHPSLESVLRRQLGQRAAYLALPHRLDVPVGGVMIVALTKKCARLLSDQFATGKVKKTYQAIVVGDATSIQQIWIDRIAKLQDLAKVQIVTTAETGKDARTQVIEINFHQPQNLTRLTLVPETGRMHQLRIGAASRGFPILGDWLYATGEKSGSQIALRAIAIEFHDPITGKRRKHVASALSWPQKCGNWRS